MSLITPQELIEHVETDLSDAALQRIIDAQEAFIVRKYGATLTQSQVFNPEFSKFLYPNRPVSTITSITERDMETDTTLSSDDYDVITTGRRIDRLSDGTNPRTYWGSRVSVVYVPVDQSTERINVLIDLCKLTLQYNALKSEKTGDYSMSQADYKKERDEIASQLNEGIGIA